MAPGRAGHHRRCVLRFEGEDMVIAIRDRLAAAELEHLGRVQGDDIVDLLGASPPARVRRWRRPARRRTPWSSRSFLA